MSSAEGTRTGGLDLALPRPPGVIRRWVDRHPRIVDVLIVFTCQIAPALLTLVLAAAVPEDFPLDGWSGAGAAASIAVGSVALVVRRERPLIAAIVCGSLAVLPLPFSMGGHLAVFVALYALGVHSTPRRTWIGYGVVAAVTVIVSGVATWLTLSGAVLPEDPDISPAATAVPNAIVYLVPTLLGLSVGNRRRYIDAIIARAADLARERDQRAQLAVADERARIAREMHDIVSHSLTVMVTLSEGAAAQAETGGPRAAEAMRLVAETGRSSLAEMRRLLGVLRAPDQAAQLAPQPGDADLEILAERFRETGLPVRLTRIGTPIADRALQLAVFRIVQEGLTNALRHAPGARYAAVTIRREDGIVTVEVRNDAPARQSTAPPGRGTGIIGVRERAALYAGHVDAGPTADGGWLLRAQLKEEQG
ncbi:sensor histidine kinase [Microbacterium sp. JZ37]|uniref:sensor histidine kinase n=1 Tax=Microbacterium sp. JZ37 TaxID=2654193 RepID=UPI002B45B37A|nr:histidine kinase [Microbacterium sp. JZ37]WRH18831.1 two-component sensor histidine kinase [Microbacterium sp. JZ37]